MRSSPKVDVRFEAIAVVGRRRSSIDFQDKSTSISCG
jgi:hypothetical protein